MKLKIVFHTPPYACETQVAFIGEDANGDQFIAKPLQLEYAPLAEGDRVEPTLRLTGSQSREFFPALVQALAESGYRYQSSDAGELKATKYHLEDMRKLVLKENAP